MPSSSLSSVNDKPIHRSPLTPGSQMASLAATVSRRLLQRSVPSMMASPSSPEDIESSLRTLYQMDSSASNLFEAAAQHGNETPSSSYVPRLPADWVLDGRVEWVEDGRQSHLLLEEMREASRVIDELLSQSQSGDVSEQEGAEQEQRRLLDTLIRQQQRLQQEQTTEWARLEIIHDDEEDDDEDEFGDFQTASGSPCMMFLTPSQQEDDRTIQQQSLFPQHEGGTAQSSQQQLPQEQNQQYTSPDGAASTSTNDLLERIDALLETRPPSPPTALRIRVSAESADTFGLVEQADTMLARWAETDFHTPSEEKKQELFGNKEHVFDYNTPLRDDVVESLSVQQEQANEDASIESCFNINKTHPRRDNESEAVQDESLTGMPIMEIEIRRVPHGNKPPLHANTLAHVVSANHVATNNAPARSVTMSLASCNHSRTPHGERVENDDDTALSMRLPLNDLTSPEARFIRRRQVEYQQQLPQQTDPVHQPELIPLDKLDLPPYFFTSPNFDDTAKLLEGLPWHFLREYRPSQQNGDSTDSELDRWDVYMTESLCTLDSALEQINEHLLNDIRPHDLSIREANRLIHDLEQNLRLSFMYHERTERAITLAMGDSHDGSGLVGHTVLVQSWAMRDEVEKVESVLEELNCLFAKERELLNRIDSFDTRECDGLDEYRAVTKLAQELQNQVCHGRLAELSCLDELRTRLDNTGHRFWGRLLQLNESMVVRCLPGNKMDWFEYERLLQAAIDLHTSAFTEADGVSLAVDWSQSIFHALCHEADRALAFALLEPTEAGNSHFNKELEQLSNELESDWGDDAKLRNITHNLVTVRFKFEAHERHLARVLCRLCQKLVDVLYVFFRFHDFLVTASDDHTSARDESQSGVTPLESTQRQAKLASILRQLQELSIQVWSQCEYVIIHCLDEFLHFSETPQLFQRTEKGINDMAWQEDLKCLHGCYCLIGLFMSIKDEFLATSVALEPTQSMAMMSEMIREKLSDVFRHHLRLVHVEAMNSMGRTLASETWVLSALTFDDKQTTVPSDDTELQTAVENLLWNVLAKASLSVGPYGMGVEMKLSDVFSNCGSQGNPFDKDLNSLVGCTHTTTSERTRQQRADTAVRPPIYQDLLRLVDASVNLSRSLLAPNSLVMILIPWFGRLLNIIEKLPLIVEDVSIAFANLCDLYLTTVFRICSGSSKNECLLLGIDLPNAIAVPKPDAATAVASTSSPLFSSFRKVPLSVSSRYRLIPSIPLQVDAEMCSPLGKNKATIFQVQQFIGRAQKSLQDIVKLDKVDTWLAFPPHNQETMEEQICNVARILERRECALWSCYVLAALADIFVSMAGDQASLSITACNMAEDMLPLKSYTEQLLSVVPTLVSIGSQFSCVGAVEGRQVATDILEVGSEWEELKLHESPNGYVDELTDRCALLWGYLSVSGKLPLSIQALVWEDILHAAYLSMLEGFARVPFCSTEGRALMTLDLASLRAGTTRVAVMDKLEGRCLVAQHPPSLSVDRFMEYVGMYIKVFYFPVEDALNWIKENHQEYHLNHCISLIVAIAGPTAETTVLVDRVKNHYQYS